jgi:hypothetical protein
MRCWREGSGETAPWTPVSLERKIFIGGENSEKQDKSFTRSDSEFFGEWLLTVSIGSFLGGGGNEKPPGK